MHVAVTPGVAIRVAGIAIRYYAAFVLLTDGNVSADEDLDSC
jgi:hypothetical protein